jgi:hypothetical protein
MPWQDEESAIQSDAYIDALLARPRLVPLDDALPAGESLVRRAADLLGELPRYHPSFAFEEALAARLRQLAEGSPLAGDRLAEVIPFPGALRAGFRAPGLGQMPVLAVIDRRLLVGGAIASGVSVAALVAWWQSGRRPRPGVLA